MLEIIPPIALILRSIGVCVDAVPVGLILLPLTIEHVTVDVVETAFPMCLVVEPLSLVASTVLPCLRTRSIAVGASPFAFIDCTAFVSLGGFKHSLLIHYARLPVLLRLEVAV
jgi:hypothetical protein